MRYSFCLLRVQRLQPWNCSIPVMYTNGRCFCKKGTCVPARCRPGLLKRRSDWQQAPPQMNQERVAALALPRQSGNTLLYSFLGRGGEEEKDFCETPRRRHNLIETIALPVL